MLINRLNIKAALFNPKFEMKPLIKQYIYKQYDYGKLINYSKDPYEESTRFIVSKHFNTFLNFSSLC